MSAAVPTGPTFAPATTGPGGLNSDVAGDYGWVYFGRPLLFVAVVVVVLLLLRWVFTPDRPAPRAVPADPGPRDYGLLVPVATVRTEDDARLLRDVLARHGIRGTVAPTSPDEPGAPPGALHVLVFSADSARARSLV